MSLGDIVSRTDAILKRYEKYVAKDEARAEAASRGPDPFMDEYAFIASQADELSTNAQANKDEENRAVRAAVNAEIRRTKAALLEGNIETLLKLAKKGKQLTPELIQDRLQKVEKLRTIVMEIPDGVSGRLSPTKRAAFAKGGAGSSGEDQRAININAKFQSQYYFESTAESSKFRQGWEISKAKQDRQLDSIEQGLGTLGEIATAMGENLQHQDVLIEEIGEKMDDVTKQLKTNNMKLHGLVTQVRSTKHFCVDVILICILLSIAGFIIKLYVKK